MKRKTKEEIRKDIEIALRYIKKNTSRAEIKKEKVLSGHAIQRIFWALTEMKYIYVIGKTKGYEYKYTGKKINIKKVEQLYSIKNKIEGIRREK